MCLCVLRATTPCAIIQRTASSQHNIFSSNHRVNVYVYVCACACVNVCVCACVSLHNMGTWKRRNITISVNDQNIKRYKIGIEWFHKIARRKDCNIYYKRNAYIYDRWKTHYKWRVEKNAVTRYYIIKHVFDDVRVISVFIQTRVQIRKFNKLYTKDCIYRDVCSVAILDLEHLLEIGRYRYEDYNIILLHSVLIFFICFFFGQKPLCYAKTSLLWLSIFIVDNMICVLKKINKNI